MRTGKIFEGVVKIADSPYTTDVITVGEAEISLIVINNLASSSTLDVTFEGSVEGTRFVPIEVEESNILVTSLNLSPNESRAVTTTTPWPFLRCSIDVTIANSVNPIYVEWSARQARHQPNSI